MLAHWAALISRMLTTTRAFDEITIVIAWALSIVASLILLLNLRDAVGGGLAVLMVAIAVVDARRFIIPDELTVAALALGFLNAAIQDTDMVADALAYAALRGAVLTFAFLSLRVLYRSVRGREGVGLGDVKLASVAGVWLYWSMVPIAIEIAALAALAVYTLRHFYNGRTVRSTTRLPFGLYFAPAIWVGWLLQSTLFLIPSTPSFQ
jgi:leader peptidase (prepilin peptidase) / N-methyltransferase